MPNGSSSDLALGLRDAGTDSLVAHHAPTSDALQGELAAVRYIHTVIRKALSDAVRWGRVERNVADLADPSRRNGHEADRQMRTWSRAQLRTFLEHVRDERLYVAWHLAAMTGMRRGEVLALRWIDLDLKRGRLAVRQTYVCIDGVAQFSEPETPRSRRTIYLDAETVMLLHAWQTTQAAERHAWGSAWQDHGLVFAHEDGTPLRGTCGAWC